jgi:spore coat polysaccharide biosynthesis protein SpsF (cytidylyltransferase family)
VIQTTISSNADYGATNIFKHTWPQGLDVEIMKYSALERTWKEAGDAYDQEHVTPYIRKHPELFTLVESSLNFDYSHYRLTVDYPEDLELTRVLIEKFYADNKAWEEIINLMDKFPYLKKINASRINIT